MPKKMVFRVLLMVFRDVPGCSGMFLVLLMMFRVLQMVFRVLWCSGVPCSGVLVFLEILHAIADAFSKATPGKDRFIRMNTLMMGGGQTIIRGLFDDIHPPSTLANALQNQHKGTLEDLKRRRVLPRPEWDKLFPSSTSCGKSEDFDLTLLFKLLRNICNLTEPSTGWDKLPNDVDLSLEADLARIKHHRNATIAHNDKMKLSENEFNDYWVQVKDALLRIVSEYAPSTVNEWKEEIDKSRTAPISAEDIKNYLLGLPVTAHELVEYKTPEEVELFLEKIEDYFEARKHKAAHAAYHLVKQAEGKPSAEFEIIHGEVTPSDRKSKFQAHLAHVTSEDQVEQVLTGLKKDHGVPGLWCSGVPCSGVLVFLEILHAIADAFSKVNCFFHF
ncbi:hypothetical protein QZH41_003581 [Actinostola sp. cb2023]|nr:hypothetical protein QZH41_003581 [Actinostola sp. cb2023]